MTGNPVTVGRSLTKADVVDASARATTSAFISLVVPQD
jgi:hypothetical protein